MNMLTTTVDGLWVLQVLTGLEVLAPELGLRPHFPSMETKEAALAHPIVAELRRADVLGDDDSVDEVIVEWLTVLARREVGLLFYRQLPDSGPEHRLLARFAQWWVLLQRCGAVVTISGVGTATTEEAAAALIRSQLQRHWGVEDAAELRPLTLSSDELLDAVRHAGTPDAVLSIEDIDIEQKSILALAADSGLSTQSSVVAIQAGVPGAPAGAYIGAGTVTIIDTPRGRLLLEHVVRDGKNWLVVGPGSNPGIAWAVMKMMRGLPAQETWHMYRKAV